MIFINGNYTYTEVYTDIRYIGIVNGPNYILKQCYLGNHLDEII